MKKELHGTRLMSTLHPMKGNLKYHVFDRDEVDPFCLRPMPCKDWDWKNSVPWSQIPDRLKCPSCLRCILDEEGNRWGIKDTPAKEDQ